MPDDEDPLTCARCQNSPADRLVITPRTVGGVLLRLVCPPCAAAEKEVLDRGGRPMTVLVVTAAERPAIFDMHDGELYFVLTDALDTWAAAQREKARTDGGNATREQWADVADAARKRVKAAFFAETEED